MKTILVDAVYTFVSDEGVIFDDVYELLESYPHNKILVTGADDEQFKKWSLDNMPYPVFTMKHNPEKTDPEYFMSLLSKYDLLAENVIYFEHNPEAVKCAESVGIKSYYFDEKARDISGLKIFLDENIK
jgi:FMN phosphatase YigB (HAD superfamily)